jgi:predicted alpha-1,2-mannosidase
MKLKNLIFFFSLTLIFGCSNQNELTSYVNPFVGTGGHGHTFPGATLPFGMVQLSPDTRIDGSWDGCGGYHYGDSVIYGFSHTHLSGTGVSDYGDFMMMPLTKKGDINQKTYEASFSHKNEKASPGYYSVKLDNGILVELTASLRVGFQKYTFPTTENSIVIDLKHRDILLEGKFDFIDDKTIAMKRISSAWAQEQHAYAYVQFSAPYTYILSPDSSKVILEFKLNSKELLIKTGFSFVSQEGAKSNLKAEILHWQFNTQKEAANKIWNTALKKIEVESEDIEKLKVFYTALYHVMIQPNLAMDVDKNYRGRDNKIHKAEGFDYYTVFSLWDTFRAAHPLYTLIDKKRTEDFIRTFLAQYQQGGRLPVWEFASNETDCMIGYHSVSVIADAAVKGINNFDLKLAFEAMKKSANWNHLGLPQYIANGYLTIEDEHESVSKTLEYAYDDWCIAQVADLLDEKADYEIYMKRSQAWKNLLDDETKLMRPRKNGEWLSPYDPREVNNHFTEGNSWQYSFFVPHDIYELIEKMGGATAFEAKLDELFSTSSQTTGRTQADITGLIGQYAHGNEPSHHMAYLYNYVGRADKSTKIINQILNTFYTSQPDGLIGNEDCGQMSAWYVLSSLGLYQVNPASQYFLLQSPHFDKAKINLENGKTIEIKAKDLNQENIYTTSIMMNGTEYTNRSFINYNKLMEGGKFEFQMTNNPKPLDAKQFPPKEKTVESIILAPIIEAKGRTFIDTMSVRLNARDGKNQIYYSLDGSQPTTKSLKYERPILLKETTQLKAISTDNQSNVSGSSTANFYKKPNNFTVKILSTYNPQYSAGGDEGLIDGIKGDENWRKGDWQGYQSQDFEAIIDLQKSMTIRSISSRYLQDTRSWILFPKYIEYYVSSDGINFQLIKTMNHSVADNDYDVIILTLESKMPSNTRARFIKVKAINYGILPNWHMGAGFDAFIFIDEIEVK